MGMVRLFKRLAKRDCRQPCLNQLRRWRTSQAAACDSARNPLKRSFACLEALLRKTQAVIQQEIAPQRTYLVEYPNPLMDNEGKLCMSEPRHEELLKGVLGSFGGWVSKVWPLRLSLGEIRYAEYEFYVPLKQAHLNIGSASDWKTTKYTEREDRRGFCAKPSWYHTFHKSKLRQAFNPNTLTNSVGTLHPNAKGHQHAMVRVLSELRRGQVLAGHNLSLLEQYDFSPTRRGQIDTRDSPGSWATCTGRMLHATINSKT